MSKEMESGLAARGLAALGRWLGGRMSRESAAESAAKRPEGARGRKASL